MYSDVSALISRLPVKFEWFVVKTSIILRVCKLIANDRYKLSMVEVACEILFRTWVLQATVKRDRDGDGSFLPPCIFIYPFCISVVVLGIIHPMIVFPIKFVVGQYSINLPPFRVPNIFWVKIWMSDNVQEPIEAFLGFLDTAIPVPLTQ
jgi:hypothetical protein